MSGARDEFSCFVAIFEKGDAFRISMVCDILYRISIVTGHQGG